MSRFHLGLALFGLALGALASQAQAFETTIRDPFAPPALGLTTDDYTGRTYNWDLLNGTGGIIPTSYPIPNSDGYVLEAQGSGVILTGEAEFDEGEVSVWLLPNRDGTLRTQGVLACVSSDIDVEAASPGAYIAATYLTPAAGEYYVRIWLNAPTAGANAFPGVSAETAVIPDPGDAYHKLTLRVDRHSTPGALTIVALWDDAPVATFPANPWWNEQIGNGRVGVFTWFAPSDTSPTLYDQFSATWLNDPVPVELSDFVIN